MMKIHQKTIQNAILDLFADSGCIRQVSNVQDRKSSLFIVSRCGNPISLRFFLGIALSSRSLLATITRSVTSRRTGFDADWNHPHAQLPEAPSAFIHIISPRRRNPISSCKIRVMSELNERYGLRPRFATFTAIRPPGSRTLQHSAKTSLSMRKYST